MCWCRDADDNFYDRTEGAQRHKHVVPEALDAATLLGQKVCLCCAMLRCAALCCAVLRCAALWCAVLRCAALRCAALRCAALCCGALCCAVLCCAVVRCAVLWWVHWPGLCCAMPQCCVHAVFSDLLVLGMSCCRAELCQAFALLS